MKSGFYKSNEHGTRSLLHLKSDIYESDGEMTVAFINQKQEIGLKR
jgi:hypothetical protein